MTPAVPDEVWRGDVVPDMGLPARLCAVSIDDGIPCAWITDPKHPRLWFVPRDPQRIAIFAAWGMAERAIAAAERELRLATIDAELCRRREWPAAKWPKVRERFGAALTTLRALGVEP